MTDIFYKIKHNINVPILLCLNLIMAFYIFMGSEYVALNPVAPGGSNSMFLACILEMTTSGLLFISLIMLFLPQNRTSYLIFDSFLVAIQLAILIEIIILNGIPFIVSTAFLVCLLALITLIDRIFDIIVLGIALRKEKQIITIEILGSDSTV